MTTLKFALGLLGAAALTSGVSQAQEADTSDDWKSTFIRVAGDDGVISRDEYIAYKTAGNDATVEEAEERFTDIAGEDDILTYNEVAATMTEPDEEEAEASDADADDS